MHRSGLSIRAIAAQMNRSPSTISRELRRNTVSVHGYLPHTAHRLSVARRGRHRQPKLLADADLREFVQSRLRKKWSPQQVGDREEHPGWGEGMDTPDQAKMGGECLAFDSTDDGSPEALWEVGVCSATHLRREGHVAGHGPLRAVSTTRAVAARLRASRTPSRRLSPTSKRCGSIRSGEGVV